VGGHCCPPPGRVIPPELVTTFPFHTEIVSKGKVLYENPSGSEDCRRGFAFRSPNHITG